MLSKGQILRARKAMERFYDGTCTITERQSYKRPNGSTAFQTVDVVTDQPCRLSYSSNSSAEKGERASGKEQVIRAFLAPEVEVRPGSRITITQNGRTTAYAQSGQPAVYATHQEMILKLWEEWA